MKNTAKSFWSWYEKHKTLNLGIAAFLFGLQIVHLIWLFGDVILFGLIGEKVFNFQSDHDVSFLSFKTLIIIVDYLEIPAIISTSLVYVNELRKSFSYKNVWFLFFINSQWLHLFWITDEFVIDALSGTETVTILPFWLAWFAIMIDYLELPVIYDTTKEFIKSFKKRGIQSALEKLKEK